MHEDEDDPLGTGRCWGGLACGQAIACQHGIEGKRAESRACLLQHGTA